MASINQTQELEYQELVNYIDELEGKEEPFSLENEDNVIPSKTNTINNPWFIVVKNLDSVLTSKTGNLSYDQKRRLLKKFKTQFVNGTKCGKTSVKRIEDEKNPPRVGDFCDFIGWKINDLDKAYIRPKTTASLSELSARALTKDDLNLAKEAAKDGIITKLPDYLGGKKRKSKRKKSKHLKRKRKNTRKLKKK